MGIVLHDPRIAPRSTASGSTESQSGVRRRDWKPLYWLGAALLLLVLQLLNGTDPLFAGLVFLFAFLSYRAVQAVGGLATLMGACIAFMAGQNVLVSQVAKVALGQAADSFLIRPVTTICVYDLAMAGIWLAAAISTRWARRRKPWFTGETDIRRLMWLSYISMALAVLQFAILGKRVDSETGETQVGGIFGPLSQVSFLTPLAIASGTAYVILSSKGRRSFGLVNTLMILMLMGLGIVSAGREGMATGLVIYAATCLAFRFKFRPIHFAAAIGGACLLQFILFPYALYARSFVRTSNADVNASRAVSCLMDVISDPAKYQKIVDKELNKESHYSYYGKAIPTLDRSSLIEGADAIVDATLMHGTVGMETIAPGFYAAIPRMFYPDKPVGIKNTLAHRASKMVGKNDMTTGITLGWVCDAFSSFGWAGAVLIPFLLSLVFFASYRFVFDHRMAFNVVPIALLFHLPWIFSGEAIAALVGEVLQNVLFFAFSYGCITLLVSLAMRSEVRIRQVKMQAQRGEMSTTIRAGVARGRVKPFDSRTG